jgi:hypothetical protein
MLKSSLSVVALLTAVAITSLSSAKADIVYANAASIDWSKRPLQSSALHQLIPTPHTLPGFRLKVIAVEGATSVNDFNHVVLGEVSKNGNSPTGLGQLNVAENLEVAEGTCVGQTDDTSRITTISRSTPLPTACPNGDRAGSWGNWDLVVHIDKVNGGNGTFTFQTAQVKHNGS